MQQDSFISTGVGVSINAPGSADYFVSRNITQSGLTQTPGRGIKFEWFNGITPQGGQLRTFKTDATNVENVTLDTAGGFTYVQSFPLPEAAVTGTAITAAGPAVVTMTNTYSEGDRVILYGTTGMLQIGGMAFTISSVSGSGFTLLGLDASAFATPATAVVARRISKSDPVSPPTLYVTKITQALNAVVTVSTVHNYQVNQLIHFSVPSSFGMSEIDQLTGQVLSVTPYTMTVNINSSSFSAFAFPTSASSPTAALFATIAPGGQRNAYNVTQVPFQSGLFIPYMYLASGPQSPAGSSGDVIVWQLWKKEN